MQSIDQGGDPELLALAEATDQLADSMTEIAIRTRLWEIAEELRTLARADRRDLLLQS